MYEVDKMKQSSNHNQGMLMSEQSEKFKQNSQSSKKLLELYQYHSPMEKHLAKIMEEISDKENKTKELKFELDQIDAFLKEPVFHIDLRPICHKCHQRSGHKSSCCKEVSCNT